MVICLLVSSFLSDLVGFDFVFIFFLVKEVLLVEWKCFLGLYLEFLDLNINYDISCYIFREFFRVNFKNKVRTKGRNVVLELRDSFFWCD